jgi:hypothetical protein
MKRRFIFLLAMMPATAPASEYRDLLLNLPKNVQWVHHSIFGDQVVDLHYEVEAPVAVSPDVLRIPLGDNGVAVEFYDRFQLKPSSVLEVAGKKFPVYCLWVQGQDNRFSRNVMGTTSNIPDLLLTRIIWVLEPGSCAQGPVDSVGEPRWESFVQLRALDPATDRFRDGALSYYGTIYPLSPMLRPSFIHLTMMEGRL